MYEIFPSSELARKPKAADKRIKYPWSKLEVGESFAVTSEQAKTIKFESMVTLAYRVGKRQGKLFRVVNHGLEVGFEVARLK